MREIIPHKGLNLDQGSSSQISIGHGTQYVRGLCCYKGVRVVWIFSWMIKTSRLDCSRE